MLIFCHQTHDDDDVVVVGIVIITTHEWMDGKVNKMRLKLSQCHLSVTNINKAHEHTYTGAQALSYVINSCCSNNSSTTWEDNRIKM